MIIGLALALIAGIILIDMAITEPGFSVASRIFGLVCGLILIAPIAILIIGWISDSSKQKQDKQPPYADKVEFKKIIRKIIHPISYDDDRVENSMESFLHNFRDDIKSFFAQDSISLNDAIQNEVTQIHYHILSLQKKRLDDKNIQLDYQINRYDYNFEPTITSNTFFDGKYDIRDVKETIRAKKIYRKNKKVISKVSNQESANYRLINAKEVSKDEFICPNCGGHSTKSNLIDGCDYCDTKFTVEDLGLKISRFDIRSDARTEYAVYQSYRANYMLFFILLVVVPLLIWSIYMTIKVSDSLGGNLLLKICIGILVVLFATASISFLLWYVFTFMIFPLIQTTAWLGYFGKKGLEKLNQHKHKEELITNKIRSMDPLFSLNGFYSYVSNILALIHFASTTNEAISFSETEKANKEILKCLDKYKDVIDMSIKDIDLVDYQIIGEYQKASVEVNAEILAEKNNHVSEKKEKIKLNLIKDKELKTQEICAPSFMRCPNCGANLSLLDSKTCSHCGTTRKISDYDWAIEEYKVK